MPDRGGSSPHVERLLGVPVLAGLGVVLTTELLSLAGAFRFPFVLAAWAAGAAGLAALAWKGRRGTMPLPSPGEMLRQADPFWWPVAVILAITGTVAILAPPSNYDSMSYHMSRAAHWVQNGSVAHFRTSISRQLFLAPWAEFAVAHLQILSGSDRFANFVEWGSFVVSVLAASAIAARLGAGRRGRALSALLVATLPMAIIQSSGTQNDLVASAWAMLFVLQALRLRADAAPGVSGAVTLGVILGIGLLTKSTLLPILAPFGIALALGWMFGTPAWRPRFFRSGLLALTVTIALGIGLGHGVRNTRWFGGPLGPAEEVAYHRNEALSIPIVASNLLRGGAVHLGFPFFGVRQGVEEAVERLHGFLGIGSADPRTTLAGIAFSVPRIGAHEDLVANPIHLVLFGVTVPWVLAASKKRTTRGYAACLVLSVLLFAATIKWQPWISRLQLPAFVLSAPVAAVWLESRLHRWATRLLVGTLLIGSLLYLFRNYTRPILPKNGFSVVTSSRTALRFTTGPNAESLYQAVAEACRSGDVRSVGLVLGSNDREYPFWALLRDARGRTPRIEHVDVPEIRPARRRPGAPDGDVTARGGRPFVPDAVIRDTGDRSKWEGTRFELQGGAYRLALSAEHLRLYIREK